MFTLSDVSTTAELEEELARLDPDNWQDDMPIDEDEVTETIRRMLSE